MRNPNSYGCIKKLSGNRRRPYVFVVSESGKQRVIGAFSSHVEALIFQTDYNREHGRPRLSDNKITWAELYHRWLPAHIEHTGPSSSTISGYRAAYLHCASLYDMEVSSTFKYALRMEYTSRSFDRLIHCLIPDCKKSHHPNFFNICNQSNFCQSCCLLIPRYSRCMSLRSNSILYVP